MTSYKEAILRSREINLSDCPGCVAELLETGELDTSLLSKDQRRELAEFLNKVDSQEACTEADGKNTACHKTRCRETRFDRINAIMRLFPNGRIATVSVDTDNRFIYNGRVYELDSSLKQYAPKRTRYGDQYDMDRVSLKQYAPKRTRYGDQYDMDRVTVIDCGDGEIHFVDQDGYDIEDNMITCIGR